MSPAMIRESVRARRYVAGKGLDPDNLTADQLQALALSYGRDEFMWYTPEKFAEVLARRTS